MQPLNPNKSEITLEEAIRLSAIDGTFFGHFFFPRAFRQTSPEFHRNLDTILDSPEHRYVAAQMFRGSAKTTKLRVYLARRIGFAISRTILVIGKSEEHAVKTIEWIKKQIEFNARYASAFGLRKGNKWSGSDIEIVNGTYEDENGGPLTIRLIALGITGSVRGVNIDDFRPDLILVDDPCDEENTATPAQRKKISDLFFGAIFHSLAPSSEMPLAKMVLLQTVLNEDDLISTCLKDPAWKAIEQSCFTPDGKSAWPERWTTEELLQEKQSFIARNMLSVWLREKEGKVVSDETAAFANHWLEYWEHLPDGGITFLAVDPTPPPKDETRVATQKHDDAVIMVLRVVEHKVFVCDYYTCKTPDPTEFLKQLLTMAQLWKAKQVCIETILFQRVLRHDLQQEMIRQRQFLTITPVEDKRNKQGRIRGEISARASNHTLVVNRKHIELIQQYLLYPAVNHDDILDALAIGLMHVSEYMLQANIIDGEYSVVEDAPALEEWRTAP